MRRYSANYGERGHILRYNGIRADNRSSTDTYSRQNHCIGTDPNIIFHENLSPHKPLLPDKSPWIIIPVHVGDDCHVWSEQHVVPDDYRSFST